MLAETWSDIDGFGVERMVSQSGRRRRYSYDGGATWRRNARQARAAAVSYRVEVIGVGLTQEQADSLAEGMRRRIGGRP